MEAAMVSQGMIPIQDLDSLGEIFSHESPYPLCSIGYKNDLLGQVGLSLASCGPDEFGEIVSLLQAPTPDVDLREHSPYDMLGKDDKPDDMLLYQRR
jgi:hypothetical protein